MFGAPIVTLMVDEVGRSTEFYRDALGFKLVASDRDTAEFEGAGMRLRIHLRRPEVEVRGSGTSAVGLSVDRIETAADALAGHGVRVGRILRAGARRVALFDDPDGNHWYLYDPRA